MSKAILVFSGGLDSLLSYKILKNAGVKEVYPIFFETPFFTSEKPLYYAKKNNIKLKIFKIFSKHKKIILHPAHGYGKNMNPCIDCHAFMFNEALQKLEYFNADFIATGEVVGQRPMSQNKRAMKIMDKIIENNNNILRPLSAKILPTTWMEKQGLVKREKLFGIVGRGRYKQIELAKKFDIKEYPSPSGGCLLTQKEYSKKLKLLIKHGIFTSKNAELIKHGRIIEYKYGIGIMGREEKDNNNIEKFAKNIIKYQIKHGKGPIGIVLGKINNKETKDFFDKLKKHSKNINNENNIINLN